MGKPYDSLYGEIESDLLEKAYNMCRVKYVDVVKYLHFRKYRETLYHLQTNPAGLSKMWDMKKMTAISEAFKSTFSKELCLKCILLNLEITI